MSKELLKKILESESRKMFKKNKLEIVDIILFGSFLKEKENPNDIDILILFKDKKNLELVYKLRKSLEKSIKLNIEVHAKTYFELFEKTFQARESILNEGYSLLSGINLAEGFGYKTMIMFNYNLSGKNKSDRMRFYYSLYGRKKYGILKKFNSIKYTDTVILAPIQSQELMREYFNFWQIEYKETPLLIPLRLID